MNRLFRSQVIDCLTVSAGAFQQSGDRMNNKPSGIKPSVFRSVMLIFFILAIAETASAKSVTVENYLKHKNAFKNYHVSWLDGVFNGLRGANSELQRTNKALLFCPPPDFSMTAQQVNAFFDKFVASHKDKVGPSDPIGILLLEALKEAYPCP
jgi:hypothetical protein